MNLLSKLKWWWADKPAEPEVIEPEPLLDVPLPIHGKVVSARHGVEYNPDTTRTGGRIVKVMPKQLKKITKAQEKYDDE